MQNQRRIVEQLRAEAALNRMTVSECVAEMVKFCEQNGESDVMIKGFPRQNDNPFREKSGCAIL